MKKRKPQTTPTYYGPTEAQLRWRERHFAGRRHTVLTAIISNRLRREFGFIVSRGAADRFAIRVEDTLARWDRMRSQRFGG